MSSAIVGRLLRARALKQLEKDYTFPFERLTAKQAADAVPTPPKVAPLKKLNHSIARPEHIADFHARFRAKDLLTLTLSRKRQALGYPLRHTDGKIAPVNLHYANLLFQWADEYNQQVVALTAIPEPGLRLKVPQAITERLQLFDGPQRGDPSALAEWVQLWRPQLATNPDPVPFDTFALYLVESWADMRDVVKFVSQHWTHLTSTGRTSFVLSCLHRLFQNSQEGAADLCAMLATHTVRWDQLSSLDLDQLAAQMFALDQVPLGLDLLKIIVNKRRQVPTRATWERCVKLHLHGNGDALIPFKLVFHHRAPLPVEVEFLLNHVHHVTQLELFVTHSATETLVEFQIPIFSKLVELQRDNATDATAALLELTQLVRYYQSRNIRLRARALEVLGEAYLAVGDTANIEYLRGMAR